MAEIEHTYTRSWTRRIRKEWTKHLVPLAGTRPLRLLEIGVFEGRTSRWLLDNVLTGPDDRYYGIDPWDYTIMSRRKFPRNDIGKERMEKVEAIAWKLHKEYPGKVTLYKGRSADIISSLSARTWDLRRFNIVYVDGDHEHDGVKADTELIWPMVMPGGIVIWDDYSKPAAVQRFVNEFLAERPGEFELLFKGYQIGVRKVA